MDPITKALATLGYGGPAPGRNPAPLGLDLEALLRAIDPTSAVSSGVMNAAAPLAPRPSMGGYVPDPMMPTASVPPQAPAPAGLLSAPPSPGGARPAGPMPAQAPQGLLGAPQPLSPMLGAPQPIGMMAGNAPPMPQGGLPPAEAEGGGLAGWLEQHPEVSRGLLEMGMRMMGASAPSLDPKSGSLAYAASQGLGGFMKGTDDVREMKRQERSDAVNEAYKMAIAAGGSGAEAPKVETIYDANGREQKVVWNAATGQYEALGGSKVTKGGGPGSGAGGVSINTKGLPKGYMWGQDPATGEPTAVPIPGLPQKGAGGGVNESAAIVIEDIDRALEKIETSDLPTTGLAGGILSMLPGTTAYDVDALISTVKANAGFDQLNKMRQNSPTGAAVGNVTEKELAYLQSVIGNLSLSQSKDQLVENLQRVRRAYQEVIDGTSPVSGGAAPTQGGGAPALPPGFIEVN